MDKIDMILENQKTIQKEIVDTRNEVLRTYRDLDQAFKRLFIRLDEIEKEIKRRPLV